MSTSEILTKLEAAVSAVRHRQIDRDGILYLLEGEITNCPDGGNDLEKVQKLLKRFLDLNTEDYQAWAELSTLLLISSGIRK